MLCLTIRQPWCWAVFFAKPVKDIENRDWKISPETWRRIRANGGRVAIHAAKGMTVEEYIDGAQFIRSVARVFGERSELPAMYNLPRGFILGTVEIADCVSSSGSPWFMGKYGFVLREPQLLPMPIFAKGAQGFWEYTGDLP